MFPQTTQTLVIVVWVLLTTPLRRLRINYVASLWKIEIRSISSHLTFPSLPSMVQGGMCPGHAPIRVQPSRKGLCFPGESAKFRIESSPFNGLSLSTVSRFVGIAKRNKELKFEVSWSETTNS